MSFVAQHALYVLEQCMRTTGKKTVVAGRALALNRLAEILPQDMSSIPHAMLQVLASFYHYNANRRRANRRNCTFYEQS
jgi:hypothetical protein